MMVDDPVKRVDNMAMAWGLETRVPFLDHEVVELAARIPAELKVRDGGKYILKEAARGIVPDAVIDRPKGYFPVPALKYIRGAFFDFVRGVLDAPRPGSAGCSTAPISTGCCRTPRASSRRRGIRSFGRSRCWNAGCRPKEFKKKSERDLETMEFRFDPHERRLRIRTLVPPGQHARAFVADEQFQFGIEEEYFLSDAETLQVPVEDAGCAVSKRRFRHGGPCRAGVSPGPNRGRDRAALRRPATARRELLRLRQNAAAAAAQHGLAILACGTHPLAFWRESVQSPKDRYAKVMDDLQMIGQRNMLCGMHVHVEIPGPDAPHRRDDPDAALPAAVHRARRLRRRSGRAAPPG